MRKIFVSIFLFYSFLNCNAVDIHKLDSLKSVLDTNFIDTTTVKTLIELASMHQLDSNHVVKYYADISIRMSDKLDYKKGLTEGYRQMAIAHYYLGEYDDAVNYYNMAIAIDSVIGNMLGVSATYNNIGLIYDVKGDYPSALNYYYKSLKIDEQIDNKPGIRSSLTNIGLVHDALGDYDAALKAHTKAYEVAKNASDKYGMAASNINIGLVYEVTGEYEKALDYHFKALEYFEEVNNLKLMGTGYTNVAINYEYLKKYDTAEEYYNKAIEIHKQINSNQGLISDYFNIALLERARKQFDQSIDHLNLALDLAIELEYAHKKLKIYEMLAIIHNEKGNGSLAYQYHRQFAIIMDSLYNAETAEQIANMEAKYQNEKKQLLIENLEQEKEIQLQINKKQKLLIISSIGVIIIILVFSIILLRLFRQKKRANLLLVKQNDEIIQKSEEISAQRDEIEAQRDAITQHRDIILDQKDEIESSINYAKRIQQAVMPSDNQASSILGDYFIIFRPKDIVSGDFYWTTKVGSHTIIAVADCTGHGVPGAFMSMLGVSFLNEIVRNKEITQANHVLNKLREAIIEALQQKGKNGEQNTGMTTVRDGMDMALIAIHSETMHCQYAGANNPIYIVNRSDAKSSGTDSAIIDEILDNESFIEVKADKMPVAIYERTADFTNNIIQLAQGDMIYMFSDGYPDQFGGVKGKKLKYKPFKRLLLANSQKPVCEQKELLEKELDKWMAFPDDKGMPHEQIDDITVLGIRITNPK